MLEVRMWRNRLASPAAALGIGLAVAILLLLLPSGWTAPLKGYAAAVLRPGQELAVSGRQRLDESVAVARRHFHTSEQLAEAEEEIGRLEQDNQRLAAELATARAAAGEAAPRHPDQADPLLVARCVPARVLGRQARAFLLQQQLLDAGSRAGIVPDALVLDAEPAVIDRGLDAELEPDRLVLDGGRAWGKIVEVGPCTSVVRRVCEAGYRDVVCLAAASANGAAPRLGPEGVLEGTGEPLARVRLIPVTEPVEVGDEVYTGSAAGVLARPLLYGRVVRVERPIGAAHWEIWMEPAAAERPERVAVLRIELNPRRVGQRPLPKTPKR